MSVNASRARPPLRVVLVDDSPRLLLRLVAMFERVPGVQVVATANDVARGLDIVDRLRPDVAVVDVELGQGGNGLAIVRHVAARHPETAVVGLSNYGWEAMRRTWLAAGAAAYFDKSTQFLDARAWVEQRAAAGPGAPGGPSPAGPRPAAGDGPPAA